MKKYIFFALLFLMFGCGTSQNSDEVNTSDTNTTAYVAPSSVVNYINILRQKAGMSVLKENKNLDTAAANHANYLYLNNTSGHYEEEGKEGYTGYSPSDRAVYAGYLSRYIIENVSVGQNDYNSSVDSLFSAIYHRFGFLNFTIDNIGVGIKQKDYVYDMGNSLLNGLCSQNGYEGSGSYYVNVCADDSLRIYYEDYDQAIDEIKKSNPEIVIWPYNGADVPPVFYNETPDPLPDYNVSGYPVSIQFNSYYFNEGNITLKSFALYDKNGNEITDTRLMDKNTDPNGEFTAYEFALFPLKRLEWGSEYTAKVSYVYNGNDYNISWNFKTRSLPYPYYRITTTDETIYVQGSKTYAYYFVPQNGDDLIHYYSYSYKSGDEVKTGIIDYNTVWINVQGASGDKFEFNFDNGDKLTLIVE